MFLHPLGLLALLGVPAVVFLHLFRRRFRRHEVSAVFLWQTRDRTSLAGRKRERLRTSGSFWLELLAALCLALFFAGPRACAGAEAEHLVCILDSSASMSATVGGTSFRDEAVRALEARIDDLGSGSRVTIVLSGSPPKIVVGPATFAEEASQWLSGYDPRAAQHDLRPAVALGQQLAGEGSVWLVTDRYDPDSLPAEVELTSVGKALENVAIVRASRTRSDSEEAGETAFVTVQNFGDGTTETRLELVAEGAAIDSRRLVLDAGERSHLSFELPAGAPPVEARLADDALAIDNRAMLAPAPPRTLSISSRLDPQASVRLGLCDRLDSPSNVQRLLDLVPDSIEAPSAASAHLLLNGSALSPAGSSSTWNLFLDPGEGTARQDLIGPFLIEKRHALMRGVTLEGIIWSRNPDHAPPGAPLVSAGDEPILSAEATAERVLFHANLDPARSSLQRSPDWPILLSNLCELRRAELPGPVSTNIFTGEDFVYRASGETTYVIRHERFQLERSARGTLVVDGLQDPGLYTLLRDGRELCEFSVSFADATESDLRGLLPGERKSTSALASIRTGFTWLELTLLALCLAFVVADWAVLSRGPRVSDHDLLAGAEA